ncbi:MAG: UvrD-helicase domain-containing protein, partial [Neobacillus sp.]
MEGSPRGPQIEITVMQKKIRYSSEQKKIIKHDSGPALVNAGAGTGKSATIIGKIDSLSKQGDRANQILVITYGRNASNAFAMRLYKELGSAANGVCVKTI